MTVGTATDVRPMAYAVAAAAMGAIVGYLRSGSIGGALAFALVTGVGVTLGILGFEWLQRRK